MYSYNNILKCIDVIKNINTTVSNKAGHHAVYNEVKKVFDICYDLTSCILFEYDFSTDMMQYREAVNNNFKGYTKKDIDAMCRRSINYLKHQTSELLKIADAQRQ